MKTATVRAPARIDLAGGTVDIWPICLLEKDAVTVNLAIDRYQAATVRVRTDGRTFLVATDLNLRSMHQDAASLAADVKLPLHREVALAARAFLPAGHTGGIEVRTRSSVPQGSGLGGSSALFVAAAKAMLDSTGGKLTNREFLRLVIDMEARVIGVPTGTQDYVAACHGGLSAIRYPPGSSARTPIAADLKALSGRLVLAWTGVPHESATNNWAITKGYLDGDKNVRKHIASIAAAARDLEAALAAGDFDAAAVAIDAEWSARRRLAPGVTTPEIDKIGRAAKKAGAQAMKACGAGGGGCVFFWCADGTRSAVAKAVAAEGGEVMKFEPAPAGALPGMTPRLDAIVLDLDDTLYDTTGLLLPWADRRAAAAMRAAGLPFEEDEILRRIRSLRAGGSVGFFSEIARAGSAPASCAEAGEAAWLVYDPPPMKLDDDVEAALDELAALAPLALLTAGHPATQRKKVERLGIARRFAACGYVDFRDRHGKTGALRALLAERGWAPARTVVCGDRPDGDILAGNRNGCLTVLVRRDGGEFATVATDSPELTPWKTIGHVRELAALLRA